MIDDYRWMAPVLRRFHGRHPRHILIVGTNARARRFAESIQSRPETGYRILGFVDETWPGLHEFEAGGGELASDLEDLAEFLRKNVVDEVALALPMGAGYSRLKRIVHICEEQGITVRFLSDLFEPGKARVEMIQDHPVVTLSARPAGRRPFQRFWNVLTSL